MVANMHPVLGHTLVGLFILVAGEGNGIFFKESHHKYSKIGGVELAHIGDRSVPLIEGVPMIDD